MDALSLLKKDHTAVKGLFKEVEGLGDRAAVSRKKLFERIDRELRLHSEIEEQIFYPAFKARAEDVQERNTVLEGFEEHAIVANLLDEIEALEPSAETFAPKLNVLMELVRSHIKEEEGTLFPMAREVLGRDELDRLGEELEVAKERGASQGPAAAQRSRKSTRGEVAGKTRAR